MSKKAAMAPTMAWRTEAIPFTMAMRHAPMVWQMPSICLLSLASCLLDKSLRDLRERCLTYAGYDGSHFECVCLFVCFEELVCLRLVFVVGSR